MPASRNTLDALAKRSRYTRGALGSFESRQPRAGYKSSPTQEPCTKCFKDNVPYPAAWVCHCPSCTSILFLQRWITESAELSGSRDTVSNNHDGYAADFPVVYDQSSRGTEFFHYWWQCVIKGRKKACYVSQHNAKPICETTEHAVANRQKNVICTVTSQSNL